MVQLMGSGAAADRPRAFVWLGPKDDPDLSEAVGQLLESSSHNFQVAYVGPKDITADSLKTVEVLAFPGGADVDNLWKVLKPVAQPIRSFVAGGGRYLGFCLGAYIAGHSPGLGLLPSSTDVSPECDEEDAQVRDDRDTVIQIHWAFSSGSNAGKTATDRWIYYQEGNFVKNFVEDNTSFVLGRYSKTDRVAATLNKYGEGWVGTIGPHPEADQSWFDLANITAPDGLQTEVGHDLINAVMSGGSNVRTLAASRPANGTEPKPSTTTDPNPAPKVVSSGGSRLNNPFRRLFRR
ncbi:hypothetical protein MY1884_001634 [Beauveria asiatica]